MSIRKHILTLEKAGELTAYKTGLPAQRRLYLTKRAVKDLVTADGIVNLMALRGMVEAGLKRWIHRGRVYVDEKGKPRFLKPLCPPPPEIWEVRFTDPRVQLRLFCRFAEANTLIATKFHTRQMLGNKGSRNWREAMNECETTWNALFPTFTPFSAKTIQEYVTENCDDFSICA
jgi:hypothetical protein